MADGLIQRGTWGGCGLFDSTDAAREQSWSPNAARCPQTRAILARIPGLRVAAFLGMAPGTHLCPHVDAQDPRMLHSLLGLAVPRGCWLRVGSEVRTCTAGACLVFDPRLEHEAANESTEVRVMLFVEVLLASAHLTPHPSG